MAYFWQPSPAQATETHIGKLMEEKGLSSYTHLWQWSVDNRAEFWQKVIEKLNLVFHQKPTEILNLSEGITQPKWLYQAELNIVDSCFQGHNDAIAIVCQDEQGKNTQLTYGNLLELIQHIAYSLTLYQLQKGDVIGIDMTMNMESVALYLAAIKAGLQVVTVADSFTPNEIKVRFEISKPKLVFTQDFIIRGDKKLPLYEKVCQAQAPKTVVIGTQLSKIKLRENDLLWDDFLKSTPDFPSVICRPDDVITILFSSGTTSAPKAIPWTHITPIKCASDGYFHQDIQEGDVVAWPTNLGWMMGPWLVFATLINKGTLALFDGSPLGRPFGEFVQNAKVTILGVVPSIVKQWLATDCMQGLNWTNLKCFSSTGEASNPDDYAQLMELAGGKPIIEYCGGTEIGGGYITSTMVQPNVPATFSTKALGSDFVLVNENFEEDTLGEVFLIPPTLGLSNTLLNKNHFQEYYEGIPPFKGKTLRRHGDQLLQLDNGYFKAQGRVDDAMNLGGIKVSSVQIEELINTLPFVKESAAVAKTPENGGPDELVLYLVTQFEISETEALNACNQLLKKQLNPLFKATKLEFLVALPRTASGKIMRRNLR